MASYRVKFTPYKGFLNSLILNGEYIRLQIPFLNLFVTCVSNVNLHIWFYVNILVFKTSSQQKVLPARWYVYSLPLFCMYVFIWGVEPLQCIQHCLYHMAFWLEGTRLLLHYAVLTIWGKNLSDTMVKVILGVLGVDEVIILQRLLQKLDVKVQTWFISFRRESKYGVC